MRPLWRRLMDGDVARGWLGRDQPGTNGDHEYHSNGNGDRLPVPTRDHEPLRSLMPDRPVKPEVHWRDRDRKPLVPEAYHRDHIRFALNHAWWIIKFHRNRLPRWSCPCGQVFAALAVEQVTQIDALAEAGCDRTFHVIRVLADLAGEGTERMDRVCAGDGEICDPGALVLYSCPSCHGSGRDGTYRLVLPDGEEASDG